MQPRLVPSALTSAETLAIAGARLHADGFDTVGRIVSRLDPFAEPEDVVGSLLENWPDEAIVDALRTKIGQGRLKTLALRPKTRPQGAPKVHPGSDLGLIWLVEIARRAGNGKVQSACRLIAECAAEFGGVCLQRSERGKFVVPKSVDAIRAAYLRALSGAGADLSREGPGFDRSVSQQAERLAGNELALRNWLKTILRKWNLNKH